MARALIRMFRELFRELCLHIPRWVLYTGIGMGAAVALLMFLSIFVPWPYKTILPPWVGLFAIGAILTITRFIVYVLTPKKRD